jgi:5-methylthioadenosine/S-adenosylhomocysteine deaminase
MREPTDLLIEPRWLLPMTPASGVLEGYAVAVDAGRIRALAPAPELRERFEPRAHVRREHHALLPGLVNAHTRASHALLRAAPPPASGLTRPAPAQLAERAGVDFVRDATRFAIAEMLRAGITCFADLGAHPEEAARVASAAQMRAAIALPVSEGPGGAENITAQLARAERLWDEYRSDPRISLFFAPLAPHDLSDGTLTRVRRVADELEARLALCLDAHDEPAQMLAQVRDAAPPPRTAFGGGLVHRLHALGLVRPGFAAIALQAVDCRDVELIAREGGALIACPQASLRTGGGAVALLEGQRTALGSDSAAEIGAFDLLAEARTAALLSGFSAAAALRLITLGGATVLGLQAHIGSLERGKVADLTCIDLASLASRACARIEAAILFGATRTDVSDVWTGGRAAVSDHRLLAFDSEELADLPSRWAQRLKMEAAA